MQNKQKHLEFIQNAIARMANGMFYLRGWAITIAAALLALFLKSNTPHYVAYLLLAILFTFWISDAYFLTLERKFRHLYDHVRRLPESEIDFSMDISTYGRSMRGAIPAAMGSFSLLIFYLPLTFAAALMTLLLK